MPSAIGVLAMLVASGPPDVSIAAELLAHATRQAVSGRAKPPWCIAIDGTDPSPSQMRVLRRRGQFLPTSRCNALPVSATRVDVGPITWAAPAWSIPIAVGTMKERGQTTCTYRFQRLVGKWSMIDVVICRQAEEGMREHALR